MESAVKLVKDTIDARNHKEEEKIEQQYRQELTISRIKPTCNILMWNMFIEAINQKGEGGQCMVNKIADVIQHPKGEKSSEVSLQYLDIPPFVMNVLEKQKISLEDFQLACGSKVGNDTIVRQETPYTVTTWGLRQKCQLNFTHTLCDGKYTPITEFNCDLTRTSK